MRPYLRVSHPYYMWYVYLMYHKSHQRFSVAMGDRGRLVLPAEIRTKMGLNPGDRLLGMLEPDGSLRLTPYEAVAEAGAGMFADVSPERRLTHELVAERRREAAREGRSK